jgi:cell division septation protein DedD
LARIAGQTPETPWSKLAAQKLAELAGVRGNSLNAGQAAELTAARSVPARHPAAGSPDSGPGNPTLGSAESFAGLTIQVGAFSKLPFAERLRKKLRQLGYHAYILPAAGRKETLYQVRVGNYSKRDLAEAIAAQLTKKEKITTLIVTYQKP